MIQNPQVGQFKLFDQHVHSWTVKEHSSVVSAQILTPENLNDVLDSPPTFLVFDGQTLSKRRRGVETAGRSRFEILDTRC